MNFTGKDTARPALLEGRHLTVWRGDTLLLDALDLSLQAGEVLQIRGPNGSGKTTLLRVLCGLGLLDEGEVMWRGQPQRRLREQFNRELLYLGHKPGIKSALTPTENLQAFCALTGADELGIAPALAAVGLAARAELPCAVLSAGQKRRVALARLELQAAVLWVLDEPLTALDVQGIDWVQQRLAEHVAGGGSVVLTTHQPLPEGDFPVRQLELQAVAA